LSGIIPYSVEIVNDNLVKNPEMSSY